MESKTLVSAQLTENLVSRGMRFCAKLRVALHTLMRLGDSVQLQTIDLSFGLQREFLNLTHRLQLLLDSFIQLAFS